MRPDRRSVLRGFGAAAAALALPRRSSASSSGAEWRVRKALKRYLANTVGVLSVKAAADYAVQQRILPVVRGRGDEFLARMRRLGQLLAEASLSRSAMHVEEALRRAEQQFGELDLFSY